MKTRSWLNVWCFCAAKVDSRMPFLLDLYHKHVAAAFERQQRLSEYLEENADGEEYDYRSSTATLGFGTNVRFEALNLGSYAEPDDSWLWAWCNPTQQLTAANVELRDAVNRLGDDVGQEVFGASTQFACEPVLGMDIAPISAHAFAVIVSGELGYDAYYTIPFSHGTFSTVIRDARLRMNDADPIERVLGTFPMAVSQFPIPDQRAAYVAYVEHLGLTPTTNGDTIHVVKGERVLLEATFDEMSRFVRLNGTVGPSN